MLWYEHERTGLGRALKSDFDAAARRLEAGLEDGVPVRGRAAKTGARRIVLKRFPYDVVFLPDGDRAVILAYAHHSRKPGYWRERVPS